MVEVAVNVELLFADLAADIGDRVRLVADEGVRYLDLWRTSDKDREALRRAIVDTGMTLWSMVAEPRINLSNTPDLEPFYEGMKRSVETAHLLGCRRLVTTSGLGITSVRRPQQHQKVAEVIHRVGEMLEGSGVRLLLENVNTRFDHPGALLDHATDCIEIVDAVNSPNVALLVDLYHSAVMKEDLDAILEQAAPRLEHVQVAGVPGRGEPRPGPGNIWPQVLQKVKAVGYEGPVGIEYFPTMPSRQSLALARSALEAPAA